MVKRGRKEQESGTGRKEKKERINKRESHEQKKRKKKKSQKTIRTLVPLPLTDGHVCTPGNWANELIFNCSLSYGQYCPSVAPSFRLPLRPCFWRRNKQARQTRPGRLSLSRTIVKGGEKQCKSGPARCLRAPIHPNSWDFWKRDGHGTCVISVALHDDFFLRCSFLQSADGPSAIGHSERQPADCVIALARLA